MALITTAEERMAQETSVKAVILGQAKIGKTSLIKTLNPETTLVIDMEAGMLAVDDFPVDCIVVREQAKTAGFHPYEFLRDFACLIAGPNPAVTDSSKPYCQDHYNHVIATYGERERVLGKYDLLFFDSITDTSRLGFSWAKTQPEAFSDKKMDKQGNPLPDGRGAYGLLGQEMVGGNGIFNQLKHCSDKDLIFVGLMDEVEDDYGRKSWKAQLEGNKTKLELAGIFDQIVSMVSLSTAEGVQYRAFVCQQMNEWAFPAGDRSGRLDVIEEPHLGKLLAKIKGGKRDQALTYTVPQAAATPEGATEQ